MYKLRLLSPNICYLKVSEVMFMYLCSAISLFVVYLTTLFQNLRRNSVDVGGKPAASAQFLLNPDSFARAI
jgi:hypothetical protein